jgi:hypothetical protein
MKFHLLIKLFFFLTFLKAFKSSISYNDDNLNIDRDESNLITDDNLHPSETMYSEWANKIYNIWIN